MSAGSRALYDSFTVNVFVGEEYLDDSIDGLPQSSADAVEDAIETTKAAFAADLTSRLRVILGPDVATTITEG